MKKVEHLKEKKVFEAYKAIDSKWDMIAYLLTYRFKEILILIIISILVFEGVDRYPIIKQIVLGWLK